MARKTARLLAGWLLCIGAIGACSTSSSMDRSDAAGAPGSYGESACAACVGGSCQGQQSVCSSDPECGAASACLAACPLAESGNVDAGCASGCAPKTGSGTVPWTNLDACRAGAAQTCAACGAQAADAGENPILVPQACAASTKVGCAKCDAERCCELKNDCLDGSDCAALYACIRDCGLSSEQPWTCTSACIATHPGAVAKYARWEGCVRIHCSGINRSPPDCDLPLDECTRCQYVDECRTAVADCFNDGDCFAIRTCVFQNCGGLSEPSTCVLECKQAYSAGAQKLDAMFNCWFQRCNAFCV